MSKYFLSVPVLFLLISSVSLHQGNVCRVDNRPSKCMNLKQCKHLMDEIKAAGYPMPILLRQKLDDLNCGYDIQDPLVCCVIDNVDLDKRFNNDDSNAYNWFDATKHPNLRLLPTNCGLSETNKITGGKIASLMEMPWMVLLSYRSKTERNLDTKCAGTIINEQYILTAAHCVSYLGSNLELVSVFVGEYDTKTDPDCVDDDGERICADLVQNISVELAVPHPNYSPGNLYDDIALVRLAKPIDFYSLSAKPICLPYTKELQTENLEDVTAVVAGWGTTEFGDKSSVLRSVELPVLSNKKCERIYRSKMPDSQFCAGGVKGKDSCSGDSGGPLIYNGSVDIYGVRNVQRGIVSYGTARCGLDLYAATYTKVSYYIKWILDNISE